MGGRGVPESDRGVPPAGDERPAPRAEGDRADRAEVPANPGPGGRGQARRLPRGQAHEGRELHRSRRGPPGRQVGHGGGEELTIGREGDRRHLSREGPELGLLALNLGVHRSPQRLGSDRLDPPEPDRPVEPARGHRLPIGRERHRPDRGVVMPQGGFLGPLGDIPESYLLVEPSRGQGLPVGREGQGANPSGMPRPGLRGPDARRRPRSGSNRHARPRPGSRHRARRPGPRRRRHDLRAWPGVSPRHPRGEPSGPPRRWRWSGPRARSPRPGPLASWPIEVGPELERPIHVPELGRADPAGADQGLAVAAQGDRDDLVGVPVGVDRLDRPAILGLPCPVRGQDQEPGDEEPQGGRSTASVPPVRSHGSDSPGCGCAGDRIWGACLVDRRPSPPAPLPEGEGTDLSLLTYARCLLPLPPGEGWVEGLLWPLPGRAGRGSPVFPGSRRRPSPGLRPPSPGGGNSRLPLPWERAGVRVFDRPSTSARSSRLAGPACRSGRSAGDPGWSGRPAT